MTPARTLISLSALSLLLCSSRARAQQQESPAPPSPQEAEPAPEAKTQETESAPAEKPQEAEPAPAEKPQEAELASAETAAGEEISDAELTEEAGEQMELQNWDEAAFDDDELEFSAVAEVEAPAREPTRRTMDEEQLTRIAGTRGDALRAIEIMPGVGRTSFAANGDAPMLRGSAPDESLVLLDGAEVPLIYHFGGLTSFYNSHLLESVDLYPGNYSARFGRASGGVVQARVRDPKSDRFHAMLELSAIDSFALVESPVASRTSVALAARRSNIDLFIGAFMPDDGFSMVAAPVYWDYQGIVTHHFSDQHKLRVLAYGSQDRVALKISDSLPEDPALSGAVDVRSTFHRGQIELESRFSEKVEQRLMVSVGPHIERQQLGDLTGDFDFLNVNARAEWTVFAHDKLRVDSGVDFQMFTGKGEYQGPIPGQFEGVPAGDSLASESFATVADSSITSVAPALYAELSYRPIDEILLIPGVRLDYYSLGQNWSVDPRLSARFSVFPQTTFKTGVGLYSQPPEYFQLIEGLGNPEAKNFRTLQTTAGFEQGIVPGLKLDVEGFFKAWDDRLVGTPGNVEPYLVNAGVGRAFGMEFLLDFRLTERTQAFLSYTLSKSTRKDGADEWRLFDADQTHNLSLTANYDLGKGWVLGGRFRYVTGNPMTPVSASVYDASSDTYRALYGATNSARNPAFHQLDVRVEKLFQIGPVGLTTYLEVMNVYNAKNREGTSYSFDFSESSGVTGMPIFPNLGIRGEL